ncbi:hypothetical protein JTE90_024743 [Oedothorax gibbosus]|uniref:Uncharacterized protein n=1 Tax=Oedothorax gibbosus TaxID=931172 RepID=A0AAV6UBW5_9ARAC|nr:hypothetical protein JTE90_024743 [Oedothorax gibbosus]
MRTRDLEDQQSMFEERLNMAISHKKQESKSAARKFMQSVKRVADNILEEKRSKRRRKGAGALRKLDSDDEDYIAKCIEEKCTAHGRRHDAIQYLHHRLRHNDLLSIATYRLLQTGRKSIRSETTVRNQGKAKYKRSRQARNHIGKSFLCKKTSKNRGQ